MKTTNAYISMNLFWNKNAFLHIVTIMYTTGFPLTAIYYITKYTLKYIMKHRFLGFALLIIIIFRYWRNGTKTICDILLWYQLIFTWIEKPNFRIEIPRQNLVKFSWISSTSTEIRMAHIACLVDFKLFQI